MIIYGQFYNIDTLSLFYITSQENCFNHFIGSLSKEKKNTTPLNEDITHHEFTKTFKSDVVKITLKTFGLRSLCAAYTGDRNFIPKSVFKCHTYDVSIVCSISIKQI